MLCFPDLPEVHLGRSPLAEVICQVRFPAILRIASEQPVEFQERVRQQFPQLEIERGLVVEGSPLRIEQPAPKLEPRIFRFKASDDATTISLTADFVSVSTTAYKHWPDFVELIKLATDTVREVYNPPYARRVGLRYINRVTYLNTGVTGVGELLDIVHSSLTASLRDPCWQEPPPMSGLLLLPAGENEKLALRSGFESGERPAFLLDFDYFGESQIPLGEVVDRCERYHKMVYRAFRWCIREGKLVVFQPLDAGKGE